MWPASVCCTISPLVTRRFCHYVPKMTPRSDFLVKNGHITVPSNGDCLDVECYIAEKESV